MPEPTDGAPRGEVLLVTPGGLTQRGGMGSVARTLLEAWPATGQKLAIRVVDPWPDEWRLAFSARSPVAFVVALGTVLRAALAGRLAIVHVHMAGGGSVLRKGVFVWLGRLCGARVVVHVAAADLDSLWRRLPGPLRRLLRSSLRRADAVVPLGAYWRRFLEDSVGLAPAQVVVIPNGVADPGRPAPRPGDGPCRLLFVGRLGERKGTPGLLAALAQPSCAALDWSLTLAGDGDGAAMAALATSLGIAGRCRFTGWVDAADVDALMRAADILVLPSHQEGLPMAILEGMAHGLAIVATRAGAIADAVTDGENGLLTPPGDVAALAAALRRLVVDGELRRACQHAARRRFERDYTAAVFAGRFADLYQRLLAATGPAVDDHKPVAGDAARGSR